VSRSQKIWIGTSGWNYKHWKKVFYPEDIAQSKWLEFYSTQFNTVELNATFYRLPKQETFISWANRTPEGFLWAVKANKFITHTKRLKECRGPLDRFFSSVKGLEGKLGPILFQLPPSLAYEENLFTQFCALLPTEYKYALEVRHRSWINDNAFQVMSKYHIAFCISDTAGRYPYYEAVTTDFVYIRLHGSKKLYASEYTLEELHTWAQKVLGWNRDTFCYFDNDFGGHAVKNARQLLEILAQSQSTNQKDTNVSPGRKDKANT